LKLLSVPFSVQTVFTGSGVVHSVLCSIVFVCMLHLSDLNKETTYLLTYLLFVLTALSQKGLGIGMLILANYWKQC